MEARKGPPPWLFIAQFVLAVLVMAFLLVGPERLDGLRQKIHGQRTGPAAPPAVTVTVPPPPGGTPAASAPAPQLTAGPSPIPRDAASTAPSPPPATPVSRTPPSPRATGLTGVRPGAKRPATPAAAASPARPISSQRYLERLMREGVQLYRSGWYGPALARFKEAARVNPGSASVQLWYGRTAMRAGRYLEGRQALERAIALAPTSDAAREARVLLGGSR